MKTRVRELRHERGLSQMTLGTLLGCSQNTISKIEREECDPKASLLAEMSKFFGVSVDYILYLTEYRNYNEINARYGNLPNLMKKYVEALNKLSNKSKDIVKDMAERLVEIETANKPR